MDVIQVQARAGAEGNGGIAGVTGTNAAGSLPGGKAPGYVPQPPPPPPPPPASPNAIVVIYDDQDVAVVATQAPHGLTETDPITISGNAEATYNGDVEVGPVLGPNLFQLALTAVPSGKAGGTWASNPP